MSELDGRAKELLCEPNYAHVCVTRSDGTIQTVVAWVHADGEGKVELNSSVGRDWPRHIERTGHATVSVMNPDDPYEYVSVVGELASSSFGGADEHIDALAKKYMGVEEYPYREEGEQRIKLVLRPRKVSFRG